MGLKEKIMDASHELFASKGYDETTVSDIIKMAGSSRGGFYHHFNSKEEILEAITDNYIGEFSLLYNEAIEKHKGSYIELFNSIFSIFYEYKKDQVKDWDKLKKIFTFKGNHVIILKLAKDFEELITSIYIRIIKDGMEKGEFKVKYPKALAGLWTREMMQMSRRAQKQFDNDDEAKEFLNQLQFAEDLINRELGLANDIKVIPIVLAYIENIKEQITQKEVSLK